MLLGLAVHAFGDPVASRPLLFLFLVNGSLLTMFNLVAAGSLRTLDRFGFRAVVWPMYAYATAAMLAIASTTLPA